MNLRYEPWRGVSADTMKFYGVDFDGINYSYPYGPHGSKVRSSREKQFHWKGDATRTPGLFGKDKFVAGANYAVTITEGELDAMSAYQMLGSKYACVSVKGAASAVKDCSQEFHWLNAFKKIYLVFDNDGPGQEAAQKVAKLFDPNKVYFVQLQQYKDANEYLTNGAEKLFTQAWWNVKPHRPKNIIADWSDAEKFLAAEDNKPIATYPFPKLQEMTWGIRTSELVLISAPQKIGKTEFLRAIEHHLLKTTDFNIGCIHLEEKEKRFIQGIAGYELGAPCHLPNSQYSTADVMGAYKKATGKDGRLHYYQHFGANDPEVILDSVRYMAGAGECKAVFLDNLTMLTNSEAEDDERKVLDHLTKELVRMVLDLDFCLFLVSHVNDAGQIFGSRMPAKLCNTHFFLSRDKESADPNVRNRMNVMVRDNRFGGETGPSTPLLFDLKSYTLAEPSAEIQLDLAKAA